MIDFPHCEGFSLCLADLGCLRPTVEEPGPVWRHIDRNDALRVDMLVRIGGDVPEVVIWKNLRRLRPNFADPGRVPCHDDVGHQCQA